MSFMNNLKYLIAYTALIFSYGIAIGQEMGITCKYSTGTVNGFRIDYSTNLVCLGGTPDCADEIRIDAGTLYFLLLH
ncbi:hypothetical protein TI04_12095 [Achromatium sp. WMS2]|nr:hypothetical protein TI04_12095 [Achromatium sp. WMS2]